MSLVSLTISDSHLKTHFSLHLLQEACLDAHPSRPVLGVCFPGGAAWWPPALLSLLSYLDKFGPHPPAWHVFPTVLMDFSMAYVHP